MQHQSVIATVFSTESFGDEEPYMSAIPPSPVPTATGNGSHATLAQTTLVGIVLALIIVTSIFGNILVCVAVATEDRLRKTGNLFIVSLAMADLLVSFLVMPFAMFNDLMGRWVFTRRFCNVWISFDIMFSTASILNLCSISVDRYMHIKMPFKYYHWMTKKVAVAMIVSVWAMSGLISFIPIHLGWHKDPISHKPSSQPAIVYNNSKLSQLDHETWSHDSIATTPLYQDGGRDLEDDMDDNDDVCALSLNATYAVLSSLISFIIPCLIMISIYACIFKAVRERVRNARLGRLGSKNHYPDTQYHCNSQAATDHKAAVTLGIIMGVFLMCWLPFFIYNIVLPLCVTCVFSPLAFQILTWLGYFNSCLNPLIYSIFNHDFRNAFKHILFHRLIGWFCLCLCKRPPPKRRTHHTSITKRPRPKDINGQGISYHTTAHTNRRTEMSAASLETLREKITPT